MKKLFSILLIVICLSASAQKGEAFKSIALFTTSVMLAGISDGLNDDGAQVSGHALNAISIGLLVASPFILDVDKSNWYIHAATYFSLRVGIYNYAYNRTRGLPSEYIRESSMWHKGLRQTDSTAGLVHALRMSTIVVGFTIPIRSF